MRRAIQGRINCIENAGHIRGQFGVPKSHNPVAFAFKPSGSAFVFDGDIVLGMMPAIEFDNEARLQAGKVRNICTNRHLPPIAAVAKNP